MGQSIHPGARTTPGWVLCMFRSNRSFPPFNLSLRLPFTLTNDVPPDLGAPACDQTKQATSHLALPSCTFVNDESGFGLNFDTYGGGKTRSILQKIFDFWLLLAQQHTYQNFALIARKWTSFSPAKTTHTFYRRCRKNRSSLLNNHSNNTTSSPLARGSPMHPAYDMGFSFSSSSTHHT